MDKSEKRRTLKSERYAKGMCVYCGLDFFVDNKKGCSACLDKKYKQQKEYLDNDKYKKANLYFKKVKWDVFEKYGGHCMCCGESQFEFLTIDHKNNDGAKERRELYGSQKGVSRSWYLKLRKEDVRNDLQILCWNCNLSKSCYGGCPHQTGMKEPDFSDLQIDGRRKSK